MAAFTWSVFWTAIFTEKYEFENVAYCHGQGQNILCEKTLVSPNEEPQNILSSTHLNRALNHL